MTDQKALFYDSISEFTSLQEFKNLHEAETAVIMGNGPSLAQCPRELLWQYITFSANKVFLLNNFRPFYYTVIDQFMIHDCAPVLAAGSFDPVAMFIRRPYPIPGSHQINCEVAAGFSKDIASRVIMGGTVTFANLQIAYYMGFSRVLLVGVDHHYPNVADRRPGFVFQAQGKDTSHFDPSYFTEGHLYAAPELAGTENSYAVARRVFESDGREIINLTPGSKLDVFERGTYEEWLTP